MLGSSENLRDSKRKYKKQEIGIPESGVLSPDSPSLPLHSPSHFSDKRRVSTISGDIYFDVGRQNNIPQMAYHVPTKPNKGCRSIDEFEKQPHITSSSKNLVMGNSRPQPTIVPIHPETGKKVDVKPVGSMNTQQASIHLPTPAPALANSPSAGRKTPILSDPVQEERDLDDQVISEVRRFSQPNSIAQGLNKMNLAGQSDVKNSSQSINIDFNEPANDNLLQQFNKETLVIGEICGQNMSDISGVRPVSCPRRGSVICNPTAPPADPPSQPGSRRPSIYAQLDEFIANPTHTHESLYRTFAVPKSSQKSSKRDSVDLPSITLSEHNNRK